MANNSDLKFIISGSSHDVWIASDKSDQHFMCVSFWEIKCCADVVQEVDLTGFIIFPKITLYLINAFITFCNLANLIQVPYFLSVHIEENFLNFLLNLDRHN